MAGSSAPDLSVEPRRSGMALPRVASFFAVDASRPWPCPAPAMLRACCEMLPAAQGHSRLVFVTDGVCCSRHRLLMIEGL